MMKSFEKSVRMHKKYEGERACQRGLKGKKWYYSYRHEYVDDI